MIIDEIYLRVRAFINRVSTHFQAPVEATLTTVSKIDLIPATRMIKVMSMYSNNISEIWDSMD